MHEFTQPILQGHTVFQVGNSAVVIWHNGSGEVTIIQCKEFSYTNKLYNELSHQNPCNESYILLMLENAFF